MSRCCSAPSETGCVRTATPPQHAHSAGTTPRRAPRDSRCHSRRVMRGRRLPAAERLRPGSIRARLAADDATGPGASMAELNEPQLQAVAHTVGPLIVFAGAGSGKTRTITYRIANLLANGTPPYRILAVTFTNKAAGEMRERLEKLGGEVTRDLFIGTFHSVCARLLRRH